MRRGWRIWFFLLLFLVFLWLIIASLIKDRSILTPLSMSSRQYSFSKDSISVFPRRHYRKSSQKVILLWTDYFGSRDWDFRVRFLKSCRQSQCRVTTNRKALHASDAVLFNSRSLEKTKLPNSRRSDQVWVLHNSEPPYYIYMDWDKYKGIFNWTSWFRRDADVYSPYGNFIKRSVDKNLSLPNFFANKRNLSFWAASSCTDRIRRYRLVAELEKHMDIDTYGSCGRLVCQKGSPVCNTIFRDYKFAFALENGQCRDYVTEKFWGALLREQVPVVLGGASYDVIAPPGSFINTRDFKTPKELAAFLTRVGRSEKLYNSYFSWRKQYDLTEDQVVAWCDLCTALHDASRPAQVYTDLKAWVVADTCSLYSMWDQIQDNLSRLWYLLGL